MTDSNRPKQNFLSPIGFRFVINRLPNVVFFIQSASIPGVTAASVDMPTPFRVIPFQGDRLTYGDFTVSIRMDEYMESYTEILDWMMGINFPDSYSQHATLKASEEGIYSDATLMILDSRKNTGIKFLFKDIFPTDLGNINMITTETDVNYVSCAITFKHNGFTVERVST